MAKQKLLMIIEELPKTIKPENPYRDVLDIKIFKRTNNKKETWTFSVSPEFTIIVSDQRHVDIAEEYGLDLDRTLAEGYIFFWPDGRVKNIRFKPKYQRIPGFRGSPEKLEQLQDAVDDKIKNFLSKDVLT